MTIDAIESQLGIRFPERHRQALRDGADPIHDVCDFLVPVTPYPGLDLILVNSHLHATHPDRWHPFLIAFASNGCGDYFAYDLRTSPNQIVYIDQDLSADENLAADDRMHYDIFDIWYSTKLDQQKTSKANSRKA